jgi:hypothetical protein
MVDAVRGRDKKMATTTQEKLVTLTVPLTDGQAMALAQLLKRIWHTDVLPKAVDYDEAYLMLEGCGKVRRALADIGYNPQ